MLKQENYSCEVAERVKTIALSEIETLTPEQRVWIENAYRRGFFQGAAAAIEGMKANADVSLLTDWLYDDIFVWRYMPHDGKFEEPIWIAR